MSGPSLSVLMSVIGVIVPGWSREKRELPRVGVATGERAGVFEHVLERDGPAAPVRPRIILCDARDQPRAKALPLGCGGAAQGDREPEGASLPRRGEDD